MSEYTNFPWLYVLSCVALVFTFFGGLLIGRETRADRYERGYSNGYEHGYQHGFNNRRAWRDRHIP